MSRVRHDQSRAMKASKRAAVARQTEEKPDEAEALARWLGPDRALPPRVPLGLAALTAGSAVLRMELRALQCAHREYQSRVRKVAASWDKEAADTSETPARRAACAAAALTCRSDSLEAQRAHARAVQQLVTAEESLIKLALDHDLDRQGDVAVTVDDHRAYLAEHAERVETAMAGLSPEAVSTILSHLGEFEALRATMTH